MPEAKRCICQSCSDGLHRCKHKRFVTTARDTKGPTEHSIYQHDFVHHTFAYPICPIIRDDYWSSGMYTDRLGDDTSYKEHFPGIVPKPMRHCKKRVYKTPHVPMETRSVYTVDYNTKPLSTLQEIIAGWREEFFEGEKDRVKPVSLPAHPPRPYDYSKCEDPHFGFLLNPRVMAVDKCKLDQFEAPMPVYHSDGAPNSYVSYSTVKDAYRAGLDFRHMACCRPEARYHPDRLDACLSCQTAATKPHETPCPRWLYDRLPKPIWSKERPYTPTAAMAPLTVYGTHFRDPTTYNMCYTAVSEPQPHEIVLPVGQKLISDNVPNTAGFTRCAIKEPIICARQPCS